VSIASAPPAVPDAKPSPCTGAQLCLHLQRACAAADQPTDTELATWVRAALAHGHAQPGTIAELALRIVDADEGAELNRRYRGGRGATNVLSFPYQPPDGLPPEAAAALRDEFAAQLGDLVICDPVVRREAREQGKQLAAHYAHMVVHGTLHLLGYDHIDPTDAAGMEALETTILAGLGFSPPYEVTDDPNDERPI
jgi:probable rRNA maturation factor